MARSRSLPLGLIVSLTDQPQEAFAAVTKVGLHTCQLACWKPEIYTKDIARRVVEASAATGVEVSALWAGYRGKAVWNFLEGPATIGLVPPRTRAARTRDLLAGADFAAAINAPAVITHAGFLPEDPADKLYAPTIAALRKVALRCHKHGLGFWFETGQETPVALLRAIHDIAQGELDNLGVNLDPANLILYGKANPLDALDVLGSYVRGVHAKDGLYPTDGRSLGKETPLGKGKVDFAALIARLKKLGYRNPVTIEREIHGPQQTKDIKHAIRVLTPHL